MWWFIKHTSVQAGACLVVLFWAAVFDQAERYLHAHNYSGFLCSGARFLSRFLLFVDMAVFICVVLILSWHSLYRFRLKLSSEE